MIQGARWLSPTLLTHDALLTLAGTGDRRLARFETQVRSYQDRWHDFFAPLICADARLGPMELEEVPGWSFEDETDREVALGVIPSLLGLLLLTGLGVGVAAGRPEGIRVPEARRNFGYFQNDLVGISLDGFGDGRSAMAFQVNAMGALRDLRVLDGAVFDREWQGVWEARTTVDAGGWTAEVRIPWSTLRYDPAAEHWRMLLVRRSRRINKEMGWPEWPREHNAYTMRFGGRLEGLEPPPPTRNVELQPYLVARSKGDPVEGAWGTDRGLDVGGEFKWGLSSNTVLDLTVNTDFAEADVDRQVVNLTRFSVFFPEQRPFFLENAGLFRLVDGRWVEPFFSRRIGLDDDGTPIPLQAGARMTHQSSRRSAGGLLVRQGGDGAQEGGRSASTFGVGRYQHNLGEFNRVGGLLSTRVDEMRDGGRVTNTVGAADWYLQPRPSTWFRGMVSGSHTDGVSGRDGWSAFGHMGHRTSWGYVGWIQASISSDYRASSGFIPRSDLITTSPVVSPDLRPDWLPGAIRSIEPGLLLHLPQGLGPKLPGGTGAAETLRSGILRWGLSRILVGAQAAGSHGGVLATAGARGGRLGAGQARSGAPLRGGLRPGRRAIGRGHAPAHHAFSERPNRCGVGTGALDNATDQLHRDHLSRVEEWDSRCVNGM